MTVEIRISTIESKNRLIDFISSLLLVGFLLCLAVNYCDAHDYNAYYVRYLDYNSLYNRTLEPGYKLLYLLGWKIGLSFQGFYGIYMTLTILLLYRFFSRLCKFRFLLLVLFILCPFLNVLQQIRSALGVAIVLNALPYLYDPEKRSVWKYLLFVILSTLLQVTSACYILLIAALPFSVRKTKNCTLTAMLIFPILFPAMVALIYRILNSLPLFSRIAYNITKYGGGAVGKRTVLDWFVYLCLLISLSYLTKERFLSDYSQVTVVLIKMTMIAIGLSVLRFVADSGYRVALMLAPLIHVTFARIAMETKRKNLKPIAWLSVFAFAFLNWFFAYGPLNPAMYERMTEEMWRVGNLFH